MTAHRRRNLKRADVGGLQGRVIFPGITCTHSWKAQVTQVGALIRLLLRIFETAKAHGNGHAREHGEARLCLGAGVKKISVCPGY